MPFDLQIKLTFKFLRVLLASSLIFDVQIAFYCTTGITIGIAIIILLGIVRYAQKKKLLFIIPSGNSL